MALKIPPMILRIGKKQCSVFSARCSEEKLAADHRTLATEKGLTLIEVLLAVAIMAIGIIGVLQAYSSAIATLEVGQFSIDAVGVIKERMADIEQMILEDGESASEGDSGSSGEFLWEWNINSTETEALNELTLTVSHNYNPRTFIVKTYVVDKLDEEEEE